MVNSLAVTLEGGKMKYLRNQVAKLAKINNETLRYYEKNGLIPIPGRKENGYRLYDEETVRRLGLIKHAKACGLTLDETREILNIIYAGNIDYDYIAGFIDKKIEWINKRIGELSSMKEVLDKVKSNIENKVDCPIKNSFPDPE